MRLQSMSGSKERTTAVSSDGRVVLNSDRRQNECRQESCVVSQRHKVWSQWNLAHVATTSLCFIFLDIAQMFKN